MKEEDGEDGGRIGWRMEEYEVGGEVDEVGDDEDMEKEEY